MKTLTLALAASLATSLALATAACDAQSPTDPAATTPATTPAHAPASAHAANSTAATPAAPKLQADLRALWNDHVVQTRAYAMAVNAGDSGAAAEAADGVVANAKTLSGAVAGFYGEAAGERMMELLGGHWGAVKAMTDSGHADDAAASQAAMTTLLANADEIAAFLSGANPNLPADAVRGLLVAHGAHHAAQIKQIMAGDMAAEVETWAAMQAHMDVIADALAGAIAKQFPDKVA
ncbi:hypothetical protein [Novilysobacter erysipheiresistens]|uniref:Uncharacterized protein n=1 Tax=Novilysobacter erysipheiresistens TaxID=1749332 RepID=A0ABU7YZ84_9GAMM